MISLVINEEKYLTLNLSKGPDVFFYISHKIFTTIIPPNFISKVAIQNYTFISAANKYYSSAGHHEQESKKHTRQIKFLAFTINYQIKL